MEKESEKEESKDQEPGKDIGAFGGYLVGTLLVHRRLIALTPSRGSFNMARPRTIPCKLLPLPVH
jgi:hypothetical protein